MLSNWLINELKHFNSVRFNEPMSGHTTFNIGGPADAFLSAKNEETVIQVLRLARKSEIPVFILGGGSNILVGDKGIRGLVVKNEIDDLACIKDRIHAGSGVTVSELLDFSVENGLTGLEFMSGIYGTLGGAVFGNAGAYGNSIGERVDYLKIIDDTGEIIEFEKKDLDFSYRKLKIGKIGSARCFFISLVELSMKKKSAKKIESDILKINLERNEKMPSPLPSAGCFFKNVETDTKEKISSGKLLEEIGAKGLGNERVGVHPKHANIIMNKGGALASDVLSFAEMLKKKVFDKHGISLEYEVRLVGEF